MRQPAAGEIGCHYAGTGLEACTTKSKNLCGTRRFVGTRLLSVGTILDTARRGANATDSIKVLRSPERPIDNRPQVSNLPYIVLQ